MRAVDILGEGISGVLWSYDPGTVRDSTYKYLDLTGGAKPYLLSGIDNHAGAVTAISYAPSTRYAVTDRRPAPPGAPRCRSRSRSWPPSR